MNKLVHILSTILLSITISFSNAATANADVVNYTNGNSILFLISKNGFLWAGTNGGLIKWNLKDFSHEKIGADGKLPHLKVTGIDFDQNNTMWLATHMGVVSYNNKKWIFYGIKNGLPSPWINHVYVDSKNTPWVSTRNGIAWFNGYFWEKKNTAVSIEQVYSMSQNNDSNYWFATKGNGIICFDGNSWKSYQSVNGIPSKFLRTVTVDQEGTVWFGTYRGVISFDGKIWKRYQIKEGLPSTQINYIFVDSKNRPWIATANGVCFFENNKWLAFNTKNGLIDNYAMAIAEDENENIYIGTKKGISRYDGKNFSHLLIKNDMHGYQISSATKDRKNTLWFTLGDTGGIESFDGKVWKYYSKNDGLIDDGLNCVSVKNDGTVWVGGFNGVSIFSNGKWSVLPDENKFLLNVNSIVHDHNNSTWFATSEGLVHLSEKQCKRFDTKDGLPNKSVYALLATKENLWIGTHEGVMKVSRDWNKRSFPDFLKKFHISNIKEDIKGNIWFATNNGAYRFDGKEWKRFGFFDGLADNRVYAITVDKNGYIWFGTFGGLTSYDGTSFKSYSRGTGLADEIVRDVVIDQRNKKWIATAHGISCLDDRMEFDNIGYAGLGAKAVLKIIDPALNQNPNSKETVNVKIKNLLNEAEAIFLFIETGQNTGTFRLATTDEKIGFVSSGSKTKDANSIIVEQGYTNFLKASYIPSETGGTVTAKAFWEDVVDKGNLDGNAVVDRFDAAIAKKIRMGYLADYPIYPGVDVNDDGKIGIEEEKYALSVNSGDINPFAKGNKINNTQEAVNKIEVQDFKPQNLPWDIWKISKQKGSKIELDTLSLDIPPDALTKDSIIEVYQGERTPSPNGAELLPVGKGYNLHPVNLNFDKPVKITIKYTEKDLKTWGIIDENSLRLGMWNQNQYQVISSKVDTAKKQVEGTIDAFPDLLNRPNRPPFAPMRTSPISNILTHSNFFTVLTVDKDNAQKATHETTPVLSDIALSPAIQVIPIPETKHYNAIGIDQTGNRIKDFKPVWSVEKKEGQGEIDQYGNFQSTMDGIVYIQAMHSGKAKKMITFLGTCNWCHYFGKR